MHYVCEMITVRHLVLYLNIKYYNEVHILKKFIKLYS